MHAEEIASRATLLWVQWAAEQDNCSRVCRSWVLARWLDICPGHCHLPCCCVCYDRRLTGDKPASAVAGDHQIKTLSFLKHLARSLFTRSTGLQQQQPGRGEIYVLGSSRHRARRARIHPGLRPAMLLRFVSSVHTRLA